MASTSNVNETSSVASSAPVASSSAAARVKPKNAKGNKTDPAWEYAISTEPGSRRVQCKFCQLVFTGSAYRVKHHLAGTSRDVAVCPSVPLDVKKLMQDKVNKLQKKLLEKANLIVVDADGDKDGAADAELEIISGGRGKRKSAGEIAHKNMFKRGLTTMKQSTINGVWKKEDRENACKAIALFFYNNAIPFNVARSDEYLKMFELVAKHGIGFKPPSYDEIRNKYLNYFYGEIGKDLAAHRAVWEKCGCTIMTDGWTDRRRRTILNFLVHSPRELFF